MAIQPIDLQGMYNQMRNVAQSMAHQQQGVKLSESMQQHNLIQQNLENAERVKQTSNDGAQSRMVKDDGGGTGNAMHQSEKHKHKSEEETDSDTNTVQESIREPYIGRIIDITR